MTLTQDRAILLRAIYPHWRIRQSLAGRWWAYRDTLTHVQLMAGCRMSLDADDLDGLQKLIIEQENKTAVGQPS